MSSSNIRTVLLETDITPPRIQRSARYIIKSNDPHDAVTTWRKVLNVCSESQLLPLLYVANEALQSIARMRGQRENKHRAKSLLEAFASILASAVREISSRAVKNGTGASTVEKVRRTIKIWGDRQVYSPRFVAEVLAACEPFRAGINQKNGDRSTSSASKVTSLSTAVDKDDTVIFGSTNGQTLDVKVEVNLKTKRDENKKERNDEDSDGDDVVINDDDILMSPKDSKTRYVVLCF